MTSRLPKSKGVLKRHPQKNENTTQDKKTSRLILLNIILSLVNLREEKPTLNLGRQKRLRITGDSWQRYWKIRKLTHL